MIKLRIKLLDKSLKMPRYAHRGDAGIDLCSRIDCTLEPLQRMLVPTGIKVAIPDGYAGFIQPKSGLAIKRGIGLINSPGLIDSGYRGEVCAILINLDRDNSFEIKKGDKICQMVIQRIEEVEIQEVEELDLTSRGIGGFGSTGRN